MRIHERLIAPFRVGVLMTNLVSRVKAEIICEDGWEAGGWSVDEKAHDRPPDRRRSNWR
ncbi:hypothetical protein [Novipirellula artificiosorum]|uniref:Uncharacterized protein n=1 Tax=Novipirellula artificiosorum TaxID=2528016 RepID=A0A5C6CBG5_9BACT|nr:hypothetical protein [Novipirellula artificiosorum]TWU21425.1 hypothetical protein Poly41_71530 [Novipirellula artificiosorum]